jgi:hypothetical protein
MNTTAYLIRHYVYLLDALRMVIDQLTKEEALMRVLRAEADVRADRVLFGDLDELASQID